MNCPRLNLQSLKGIADLLQLVSWCCKHWFGAANTDLFVKIWLPRFDKSLSWSSPLNCLREPYHAGISGAVSPRFPITFLESSRYPAITPRWAVAATTQSGLATTASGRVNLALDFKCTVQKSLVISNAKPPQKFWYFRIMADEYLRLIKKIWLSEFKRALRKRSATVKPRCSWLHTARAG